MKPEKNRIPDKNKKNAILFVVFLIFVLTLCLGWILYFRTKSGSSSPHLTAEIYQNGELLQTIDLSAVTESDTFTVTGTNGCSNTIEVRPGSIGIISADCPDKLCVRQGFISDSLLPVTCLPNRLVIRIVQESSPEKEGAAPPDVTAY